MRERVVDHGQEARMGCTWRWLPGKCGWLVGIGLRGSSRIRTLGDFLYVRIGYIIPDVHERLVPPRILEKFTPKKVKKGSSITFSVKVEGEATLAERLTTEHSVLSLAEGPVPGGVLSLSGMDSLPSDPQDTRPPLCIGSRRRQRKECCGLALIPLATPWPALASSIAWSCWTWADSIRAPTHASPPMLLGRRSALPVCMSQAVSEGSGVCRCM